MRLRVLLPTRVLVDEEVEKASAEAQNGAFTLLPRHVDFVIALVPGLLEFVRADGREAYVAIDEGILVKCGPEVRVSTRNAISGTDLGALHEAIRSEFEQMDEHEREVRSALVGLEMDIVRRFIELGD